MKRIALLMIVFVAVTAVTVFSCVSFAQEQGKVRFENGEILFPENKISPVKIKDLKLGVFPEDTPEEILFQKNKILKGRVYNGWDNTILEKSDTVYLIFIGLDPVTKIIKLFQISDNSFNGRPAIKLRWEGEYKGLSELNSIRTSGGEPGTLYITKTKNSYKYKVNLRFSNGNGVDLASVAEFSIPEPAPKKEPELSFLAVSNVPISECQWLIGSWIGAIDKEKETRSLQIFLFTEGIKAAYGVTGQKMGYTKLEIFGDNVFL